MSSAISIRSSSFIASPASGGSENLLRRCLSTVISPRSAVALHLGARDRRNGHALRRVRSEADMVKSAPISVPRARSPVPESAPEDFGGRGFDLGLGLLEIDGGIGNGGVVRGEGGRDGGDWNEKRRIGEQYREMIRMDPLNPLLLMNYGRFLHEVEGDAKGAEECYGRAILACPGDGEALSQYGKLVWETDKDEERAEAYFERAVEASPDDCYVLGSYAHFLWDSEEAEEERKVPTAMPLVEAL